MRERGGEEGCREKVRMIVRERDEMTGKYSSKFLCKIHDGRPINIKPLGSLLRIDNFFRLKSSLA